MLKLSFLKSSFSKTQIYQQNPAQTPYQAPQSAPYQRPYQQYQNPYQQQYQPMPYQQYQNPYQQQYQPMPYQQYQNPYQQQYQPMPYQIPSMYPPQPAPYQIPNVFQNPFNNPSSNVFNQSDGVMGQVDQFITDVNTGTFQNMVNIDPNAGKNPQNLKDPAAAKYYNNQPISPEANIFNQADKLDDTVLEFVKQHGGTPLI